MKGSKSLLTLGLALACAALTFGLAVCARAQTLSYLAAFNGVNGYGPSTVIQAADGNYYGVTSGLGAGPAGMGNVVRITPAGVVATIYNFCSLPHCTDGAVPITPPILGSDGNLYGVTAAGGSDLDNGGGWGTVYTLTLDGQLTTLYTFCTVAPCSDGERPNAIIQAADGNFYGTTSEGGEELGSGTLFRITAAGKFSVVHAFCSQANCADGEAPASAPIQGIDGSLIGTAAGGGTGGGGVVYKLTPSGNFKVVHSFACHFNTCPKGSSPNAIVQDANGNLFGVTGYGDSHGWGNIFEITSAGEFVVLHSFTYGGESGAAALTLANDGNLYGTTAGIDGYGTLYEMTPEGTYTTLHNFTWGSGSTNPMSGLFQATNGNLYGAVEYDGLDENGAVYIFDNSLGPLVETVPVQGSVGASVIILGNNLTGSTSVTFNGVDANFTVESDTYIRATVPVGATTGVVSVVTPSGTLKSNPQFVVSK